MGLTELRDYLAPRRHTLLLAALVTAVAVRPLVGDGGAGPVLFSLALVGLLLVALHMNTSQRSWS
jgi:hypothetical protein